MKDCELDPQSGHRRLGLRLQPPALRIQQLRRARHITLSVKSINTFDFFALLVEIVLAKTSQFWLKWGWTRRVALISINSGLAEDNRVAYLRPQCLTEGLPNTRASSTKREKFLASIPFLFFLVTLRGEHSPWVSGICDNTIYELALCMHCSISPATVSSRPQSDLYRCRPSPACSHWAQNQQRSRQIRSPAKYCHLQ